METRVLLSIWIDDEDHEKAVCEIEGSVDRIELKTEFEEYIKNKLGANGMKRLSITTNPNFKKNMWLAFVMDYARQHNVTHVRTCRHDETQSDKLTSVWMLGLT
jgi:hypothetical protein